MRIVIQNHHEIEDKKQLILAFVLTMKGFFAITNVITNIIAPELIMIISASFYILTLIYIIVSVGVRYSDLGILGIIYSAVIVHTIIFNETRNYFFQEDVLIVLFFYFPYCVILIRNISNWDKVLAYVYQFASVIIAICAIVILAFPYEQYIEYMNFSYAILPSVCACYYGFHTYKKLSGIVLWVIGMAELIAYGARNTILFAIIYVLVSTVIVSNIPIYKKIIISSVLGVGTVAYNLLEKEIFYFLSNNSFFANSYFVRRYLKGNLFNTSSRSIIWEQCYERLRTMGGYIGGFFGDRYYCEATYPHNVFLEILMSWGWVIGSCVIVFLLYKILKSLYLPLVKRDIAIFIFCAFFSRYLVSGSYIIEGNFWLFISIILAINKRKRSV